MLWFLSLSIDTLLKLSNYLIGCLLKLVIFPAKRWRKITSFDRQPTTSSNRSGYKSIKIRAINIDCCCFYKFNLSINSVHSNSKSLKILLTACLISVNYLFFSLNFPFAKISTETNFYLSVNSVLTNSKSLAILPITCFNLTNCQFSLRNFSFAKILLKLIFHLSVNSVLTNSKSLAIQPRTCFISTNCQFST